MNIKYPGKLIFIIVLVVLSLLLAYYAGTRRNSSYIEKIENYKSLALALDSDAHNYNVFRECMYDDGEDPDNDSDLFLTSIAVATLNNYPKAYFDAACEIKNENHPQADSLYLRCLKLGAIQNECSCLRALANYYFDKRDTLQAQTFFKKYLYEKDKLIIDNIKKHSKRIVVPIKQCRNSDCIEFCYMYLYEFNYKGKVYSHPLWSPKHLVIGDSITIMYDSINPKNSIGEELLKEIETTANTRIE